MRSILPAFRNLDTLGRIIVFSCFAILLSRLIILDVSHERRIQNFSKEQKQIMNTLEKIDKRTAEMQQAK